MKRPEMISQSEFTKIFYVFVLLLFVQSFIPFRTTFIFMGKVSLSLIGNKFILVFGLNIKGLLIQLDGKVIQDGLEAGPRVGFLFAENNFIIESYLKTTNIRKKHIFFSLGIVVLVLLLLYG